MLLIGSPILDSSCTKEKKGLDFGRHVAFFVLYISNKVDIYELFLSFFLFSFLFCFLTSFNSSL